MGLRVADRVEDWDERPVEGGYAGLSALADEEFSGVVRTGGAELYMTAGTVVGIQRGTIEDFQDGSGTAYEAPDPALPLLCIMQAANADVRAQYYTEDTPISEVDGTLSDGGFSGYLELSENVLSGDYFLVYHGGTSSAVGFVGAAERLITGDEAFETAADEVGIYKVRQVDIEPIDIPEPSDGGGVGASEGSTDGESSQDTAPPDAEPTQTSSDPTPPPEDAEVDASPTGTEQDAEPAASEQSQASAGS
ncbi:MAG: transcriptional regulator, partial [Salinirussus sp.]